MDRPNKIFISILFLSALTNTGFSESLKEQIAIQEILLQKPGTQEERSQVFLKLAHFYSQDQELDKAFFNFLEALKNCPHGAVSPLLPEEEKLFNEAFQCYLSQSPSDPFKASQELLMHYEGAAKEHPEYLHLNFLLSAAYANLGKYPLFFQKFYRAYPSLWDSYLSYKTQGVLYLRLSQREKSPEGRQKLQKVAVGFLTKALQKEPLDAGIYKILVSLAKEEQNMPLVLLFLQKLTEAEVPIPRGDIFLYVKEAVTLEEYELGQELIDQARKRYEFSRALTTAQDYLDQYKNG